MDRLEVFSDVSQCANSEFDLAIAVFGVLAHIANDDERATVIRTIRSSLKAKGSLLCTVPNIFRRFPLRVLANLTKCGIRGDVGTISYERRISTDRSIRLPYRLYSPRRLCRELTSLDFTIVNLSCESILPESIVTRIALSGKIDSALSRWMPAWAGYGIAALAQRR